MKTSLALKYALAGEVVLQFGPLKLQEYSSHLNCDFDGPNKMNQLDR